jgi:copper transport protein
MEARALPVRAVHVAGVAVWAGGLAVIGAFAIAKRGVGAGAVLQKFATVAPSAAFAGIAAGALLAYDVAPSPGRWLSTDYGHVLLFKLGAVMTLGLVATQTRRWVRRGHGSLAVVRNLVSAEIALAAVVLVSAAVLAGRNPNA